MFQTNNKFVGLKTAINMDDRRKYITAPRDLAAVHCRSARVIENRCKELTQTNPDEAGDHGAMYISSAMLRAFSIELALKSLCYADKSIWEHGHCLKTLFEKQTIKSQEEIKQIANTDLSRQFEDVLSEISNVFVDWRYVHEKLGTGASLGFDTDEMKAITHAVLSVLDGRVKSTV